MELIRIGSNKKIKLSDSSKVIIGRCSESLSDLKNISRSQVSLVTNTDQQLVIVTNLGDNPIKVNGDSLTKLERISAKGDSEMEFPGKLKFKICKSSRKIDVPEIKIMTNVIEEIENRRCELTSRTPSWIELNSGNLLLFTSIGYTPNKSNKVAAFDMDGTLIKTKSGRVFPLDENDWTFLSDSVVCKLRSLSSDGYNIVIFTNQGGIASGSTKKKSIKRKIENMVSNLKIPLQVFIASGYDFFRKPCPGMWFAYVSLNGFDVVLKSSFYVGDAAGRAQGWSVGKKKDFSMADRLFARNIQLDFLTPEELFFKQSAVPFDEPPFDPNKLEQPKNINYNLPSSQPEVIIMVGSPGSGKSHFINTHLIKNGYVSICRDVLGSWQSCLKVMDKYIDLKRSIVIDNTNPTLSTREKFICKARSHRLPLRCFLMETTIDHCKHNNRFRQLTDDSHVIVSDVIINGFWKNYEPPDLAEGFNEIVNVPFIPDFANPIDSYIYKLYLN